MIFVGECVLPACLCTSSLCLERLNMLQTKFVLDRFEVYGSVIDVDVEEYW